MGPSHIALIFVALFACAGFSAQSTTINVLEIRCGQTPLDADNKCPIIERAGAELEFIINPQSQNVQMTVLKNDGNWFIKSQILDHCKIVDAKNWECGDRSKLIKEVHVMWRGHYYRTLTGGYPPNYYTSSISGLVLTAYKAGLLSLEDAQKRD